VACGNGVVDTGEECDDGDTNETDSCRRCRAPRCGDGVTDAGETCDDGDRNGPAGPCSALCADVDECLSGNGGCDPHAACLDLVGGRDCACRTGWSGDGLTCANVDECASASNPCGSSTCMDTDGSYECSPAPP
jgi:hypothetical protein